MVTPDLFVPQDMARSVSQWWGPAGRAWLSALPELVARAEVRWSIRIGRAYSPGGATAFVAPGVQTDGTPVVVKIAFPHREARHEAAALALYDGDGAVRLIADDPDDHVLVLEQCQPGCPLADACLDDQLAVATGLLRRLWKPVPLDAPFESLADLTADWADLVDQRWEELRPAWDRSVVVEGATLLRELPAFPTAVLLHQDFHPGNVLAARREPWLVIDPNPVVGDPAFDTVQLVTNIGELLAADDPVAAFRRRVAALAGLLDLDAWRIRAWVHARAVEGALWDLTVGDPDASDETFQWASIAARA